MFRNNTSLINDFLSVIESADDIITSCWNSDHILQCISSSVKNILGYEPSDLIFEGSASSKYSFISSQSSSLYYRLDHRNNHVYFERVYYGYSNSGNYFHLERVLKYESTHQAMPFEFQDFVENGSIPLHMIGSDGVIIWANNAELNLLGYERHEYVGKCAEVFHVDLRTFPNKIKKLLSGVVVKDFPARLKRKDGTVISVLMDSSVARDNEGNFLYTRCFTRDITDLEQLNEFKIAEKAANEALKFKTVFLSTVAHDIRTPINGIIGMSSLLLETAPFTPQQKDYVDTIAIAGDFLLTLVNDVLDLSKAESGKMTIECIPMDIVKIMYEIRKIGEPSATKKGLDIILVVNGIDTQSSGSEKSINEVVTMSGSSTSTNINTRTMYLGDPFRLKQILMNYLSNSIKFTKEGSVTLTSEVYPSRYGGEDIDEVKFTVQDTGIGIEDPSKLFRPFVQADSSISRQYGGTGLGLSICRKVGELMGGTTGVESTLGQGSTFWLILPLKRYYGEQVYTESISLPEKDPILDYKDPKTVKLLVADDNRVNQKVIMKMLNRLGYHNVIIAENGQQAVQAVQQVLDHGDQEEMFDIIFMDMLMPIMDGLQATEAIRGLLLAANNNYHHIPILALTANGDTSDRTLCLNSGMDDFLSKPITIDNLRASLQLWTKL